MRRPTDPEERYKNEQIHEFISENKEEKYDSEANLQKRVVEKMNEIAKENSEIFGEEYEIRQNYSADMAYMHIRCKQRKCEFNVWYKFTG